jgi:carboxyl-terminal processing protease
VKSKSANFRFYALLSLIILLNLAIGLAGGYYIRDQQLFSINQNNYPLLEQAYELLLDHGYYPLPDQKKVEYGMIRGLLQAYNDPYTTFVEPPQHELQSQQLRGKFGGIGARIERDSQNSYRLYPFADSPARREGLLDGDILIEVDKVKITTETTQDDVLSLLRGEKGTSVQLVIFREEEQREYSFQIVREEIPIPSVTWNTLPEDERVGLIQVNLMSSTTPDEIQKAIEDLIVKGADHFILDLRNNGGGLVDTGVKIAELFLPADKPILTQTYRDKPPQTIQTSKDGPFTEIPLVIFTNNSTASAAEITAGALKAQQRARLVGTPTFGKYTIQLVFDLKDGSSLHVTAAEWEIPGLEPPIRDHGVLPDDWIENETPENLNNRYLQAALQAFNLNANP